MWGGVNTQVMCDSATLQCATLDGTPAIGPAPPVNELWLNDLTGWTNLTDAVYNTDDTAGPPTFPILARLGGGGGQLLNKM